MNNIKSNRTQYNDNDAAVAAAHSLYSYMLSYDRLIEKFIKKIEFSIVKRASYARAEQQKRNDNVS